MARTSRRNFLSVFRSIQVDADARGPDVSNDVGLVYIVDDVRQRTAIDAGSGTTEAAVIGEHAIISLQCRVPGGMEVHQITMNIQIPAFGTTLRLWTSGAEPVITGPNTLVTVLRTTGLVGQPEAPLSVARAGTILTAAIPADTFRYLDASGFTPPFWLNSGQFFNVAFATANLAVDMGIRWRELQLFS